MKQVLVLNASYEALNVCSVRRAHVLVFKCKAEVVEALEQPLRSASNTYQWPHVIRLVTYVSVPRTVQRKISRRALFARDGWRCAYCGTSTEIQMVLRTKPRVPQPVLYIRLATPKIPAGWKPYLPELADTTAAA